MKKDIHPKWYPNAKVIVEGEEVMTVGATIPEINVEIWSGTHPFYTGTQRLLDTDTPVGRLRGKLHRLGAHPGVPLVVTYHPAYLLRSPREKRKSWQDLQLAMRIYREQS